MLESNLLIKNLMQIAKNKDQCLMQNLALDILNWILMIRLSRYRCPRNVFNFKYNNKLMESVNDVASTDVNLQQSECVRIMSNDLSELIQSSILLNNRSVAHKCVKLLVTCLNGAQTMMDQKQRHVFEVALKNGILESIPYMASSNYAGSLRWFSILIAGTSSVESQGVISTSLMKLLIDVLQEISNRPNPMNSLLQARFGLYSTPFESELFDSDLTALNKNNFSVFYASVLKATGSGTGQQQQNQLSDLKSFCVQGLIFLFFLLKFKLIFIYNSRWFWFENSNAIATQEHQCSFQGSSGSRTYPLHLLFNVRSHSH
jgi:baculoviral IAP repeat-containing protein 6